MVRRQQRTDRRACVSQVPFPLGSVQTGWPQPVHAPANGSDRKCPHYDGSATTEEERGDPGADGGSGETKRARLDGQRAAESAASHDPPANEGRAAGDRVPPPDQLGVRGQGPAEQSEDSRASELQSAGSLKVTIQRSSESREFGQTDRTEDRQTGGLRCHVCDLTCRSAQEFHEHMSGAEHVEKLQEITQSICLNTHTLQDRGRRPHAQRWCDTCRTDFSGDVIAHRRTQQHKMCQQLGRPFCPVCQRHFRTPRKFVEHMKSPQHKQQVRLQEAQEEELITVDAVGCFNGEEEEEEEEEAAVADDEECEEEERVSQAADDLDPLATCGSSFVVPVSGFLCRLCNKFFHRETTARRTHCRTLAHHLHLQTHSSADKHESEDPPAQT